MKKALLTIIILTACSITATAQNNAKMKKVLFVVTSHDKLGNTGQKNRILDRRIGCALL